MANKTAKKEQDVGSESQQRIRVGVGYGWMKIQDDDAADGRAVLSDVFWRSLKKKFEPKHASFVKNGVMIDFSRLRASHGKPMWDSILDSISKSDVLIFDVAASPVAGVFSEFRQVKKPHGDYDLSEITCSVKC